VSTTVATPEELQAAGFYGSVIGKKIVMAVTGILLFGFIVVHLIGNLLIYLPRSANGEWPVDHYASLLRVLPEMLWSVRIILLAAVILHILAAWQLTVLNKFRTRQEGYVKYQPLASSYASRTMIWSGPIIFFYVIYHLLDLTYGKFNPHFEFGHVHANVIESFSHPVVAIFYVVANVCLAFHLYHGLWSMCQSVGLNHPRYTPVIKAASKVIAIVMGVGFCSIPLSVLAGLIH
jgi:succinate dehydrogenase cytochrome b subunit